jgi:glutathione S-transferase
VNIVFRQIAQWLGVIEEVVGVIRVKLLEAHKFPRFHAWIKSFKEAPVIKLNLPDRDAMLVFFKRRREVLLASSQD